MQVLPTFLPPSVLENVYSVLKYMYMTFKYSTCIVKRARNISFIERMPVSATLEQRKGRSASEFLSNWIQILLFNSIQSFIISVHHINGNMISYEVLTNALT